MIIVWYSQSTCKSLDNRTCAILQAAQNMIRYLQIYRVVHILNMISCFVTRPHMRIYIYIYIRSLSPPLFLYIYSATVNVISYILSIIEIWSTSPHTKTSLGLIIILYLLDILCSTVRLKMYLSVHQWSIHRSVFYPMYCQVSILLCGTAEIPIYSVDSINHGRTTK